MRRRFLRLAARFERLLFVRRKLVLVLFAAATLFMLWSASRLRIDAGFTKLLPLQHPYIQTYLKHQQEFGGANRVLVALVAREGDIFTAEFLDTLKRVTDEVFFLPGIDRGKVQSLFTPNVRYTEVIEDGIAAGNVIPDDFAPTPEGLAAVRRNVLKAGIVGRLVANDFSAAIVAAELMEVDPTTGARLDLLGVSELLEEKIRRPFDAATAPDSPATVHILGFVKVMGDIAAGAKRVILFFGIAVLFTGILVALYAQSFRVAGIVIGIALVAVIWQLGLIPLLGFGMDPMSILVPFLIFAIAVSHAVQMVSANRAEIFEGFDARVAARRAFRKLIVPGGAALATDIIGFVTILVIAIRVIREIAIAASLGVTTLVLTNLVLLPVVLSYFHYDTKYRGRLYRTSVRTEKLWRPISRVADRVPATVIVTVALALLAFGVWKSRDVRIGDLHRGVPELRADSRYNRDTAMVTSKFSIGVDILNVIVETEPDGCIDYSVMSTIDEFSWRMANVEGVQSTIELAGVARTLNAGWNEGSPKWRVLPRNQSVLTQSVAYVPTATGLLNADCSVMPVMLFTADHKAETINRIVAEVKSIEATHGNPKVAFRLATGNVGVMAATNEAVSAAQFPMLAWVFGSVILFCLLSFRSVRATICILTPLVLVSYLAYALMALLEIGLKVGTLPVVALGVGVGVDYGIYVYSRFQALYGTGRTLRDAYHETLSITGSGVLFTGSTLGVAVATWIFSPLKFQADMGILLFFLFVANMAGTLVLLPALARFLLGEPKVVAPAEPPAASAGG
ncbi:MAG TPA: MMPL family transporter [Thermoanaerobaculia bacterium]|nr:MMPL family transporter [Thermoanaerobaculia bacterium]